MKRGGNAGNCQYGLGEDLKNNKSTPNFLRLIFSSFFRWWWAVITGVASIAGWLSVPQEGLSLTPLMFSMLILLVLTLFFLALSTVYQGWLLYQEHFTRLRIVGFLRSDIYGSEYVFLLEGNIGVVQGAVMELKRFHMGVEVTIALVEIMEKNSKGQYQARPIWFSSNHFSDLRMGQFAYSEIDVEPFVKLQTFQKAKNQI